MPRPLKLLQDIVEEDPSFTQDKIDRLLGEAKSITDDALKQLTACLRPILEKDRAPVAECVLIMLGVRFWNDIRAANVLIRKGFIFNAMMMERDAIETRVLAEYLYKNQQEARAWWEAENKRERKQFTFSKLVAGVKNGHSWEKLWNTVSMYIHPTSQATPAYSGTKQYFGHNLYLGGFYAPLPIAFSFTQAIQMCLEFTESFMQWFKEDLPFPLELSKNLEMLVQAYHDQDKKLMERARLEQQKIDSEIEATRLSKEQIIQLWGLLR